jgi:hypothetical protein
MVECVSAIAVKAAPSSGCTVARSSPADSTNERLPIGAAESETDCMYWIAASRIPPNDWHMRANRFADAKDR